MHARRMIAIAAGAALAVVAVQLAWHSQSAGIARQAEAFELRPVLDLLAGVDFDNDVLASRREVYSEQYLGAHRAMSLYRARRDGVVQAVVIETSSRNGYGGVIELMVGVARDGTVLGVHSVQHSETRGIGAQFADPAEPWLVDAYRGASLDTRTLPAWQVRSDGGEVDQLTGATVTSRAVTEAVRDALLYLRSNRQAIFDAPDAAGDTP